MYVSRFVDSMGFKNFNELLKALKSDGSLIDKLPYPLRLNEEVILEAIRTYPYAVKYIDIVGNDISESFLTQIFLNSLEAFLKLGRINESKFKVIINNIGKIENIDSDKNIQDKLYDVFFEMPVEYIVKYRNLLCRIDFFKYYSSKVYMNRFAKSNADNDDVVEKILAFESAFEESDFTDEVKISLLFEVLIPKFGRDYFEIFYDYISSNYSAGELLTIYKRTYITTKTGEFILYYITRLSRSFEIKLVLNRFFGNNSNDFESYFCKKIYKIKDYIILLIERDKVNRYSLADDLFAFLLKYTNIDVYNLIEMFDLIIDFKYVLSCDECKTIIESYNYLLSSVTDNEERNYLESLKK